MDNPRSFFYATGFSLILRCLIVLQYLSSRKARVKRVLFLSRSKPSKACVLLVCVNKLGDQHVVVQRLYDFSQATLLVSNKCERRRLQCVRRKRVFCSTVCLFSHLNFLKVIEKVHSCFKSQSDLCISSVSEPWTNFLNLKRKFSNDKLNASYDFNERKRSE